MHPSDVRAAKAVVKELAPVTALLVVSLLRIIPWASKVDTTSTEELIAQREGITGNHLAVGGMDRMITPLQVSSVMATVLRLLIATFRILRSLMVLDFSPLDKYGLVECLLCVGSLHIRTFSPLVLYGVPSLLCCACGHHTKTSDISAIEGDVASHELVTEHPFVEGGVA